MSHFCCSCQRETAGEMLRWCERGWKLNKEMGETNVHELLFLFFSQKPVSVFSKCTLCSQHIIWKQWEHLSMKYKKQWNYWINANSTFCPGLSHWQTRCSWPFMVLCSCKSRASSTELLCFAATSSLVTFFVFYCTISSVLSLSLSLKAAEAALTQSITLIKRSFFKAKQDCT